MAYKGGRVSTTWEKGKKPPVQKPKGAISRKTKIKQALGIKNWKELEGWVDKDGIVKFVNELQKLKGKDYVYAMGVILEFVKPKLNRTALVGDPEKPISISVSREKAKEINKMLDESI